MTARVDALAPCEAAVRIGRLVATLDAANVDVLVVTNLRNIRYLTGFSGSAATLVVGAAGAVLCTDGRYATQAPEDLGLAGVRDVAIDIVATGPGATRTPEVAFIDALRSVATPDRVGLEEASATWADQRRMADWLAASLPASALVPTVGLVEALRVVKDAGEVARIELAAGIADASFAEVRTMLADRPTEAEFGIELDLAMRRRGATERSFETIVASGPNAALPHVRPGPRRIERGDLVVVDFGAMVDGYRSDMTRTVMVGEPSSVQQRLLDVVTAAQAAGVAAVGPGAACAAIDAACRGVIGESGWGEQFVHGTGHGVGLDIHEAPWVNAASLATLAPGTVVTVEPGVYLPGVGGVRVEDTVLVTETGARPLTRAPKDPVLH